MNDNIASGSGGAIYVFNATLNITLTGNAEFKNNIAWTDNLHLGGGAMLFYNSKGTIKANQVLFEANTARDGGAVCAVYASSVTFFVNAVTFYKDTNKPNGQSAPSVYSQNGSYIMKGT
jgi:predicted outer membrane repeat protein